MKHIKPVVAGLVLCSALWTACNKASYNVMPGSPASLNAQAKMIDNSGKSMFAAGYLNVPYISVKSNGNLLTELRDQQVLELFVPLSQTGLPLQPDKYENFEATIDIAPNNGAHALFLRGLWTSVDEAGHTGETIPVELSINAPLRLHVTSDLMTLTEKSNLLALLNVDPTRLTENIPNDMWRRAVNPETGGIVISDQLNTDLYNSIIKNLGQMIQISSVGDPGSPGKRVAIPCRFLSAEVS